MRDKIFLVGMPGSGKSTLGKQLADLMGFPFLDLDDCIEKSEGKLIRQIFAEKGEEYFRQLESVTLDNIITEHEQFVVACGGGTPCFHDNMHKINESGLSIYLKVSKETLIERLKKADQGISRPLIGNGKNDLLTFINTMLAKRMAFYDQAMIVHSEGQRIESLMEKIVG